MSSIVQFIPLKNSVESRPTLFRVCRHIQLTQDINSEQWGVLNYAVASAYFKDYKNPVKKVSQKRIFGSCKYKKKVNCYPESFIPKMIIIINEYIESLKPKREKRVRIKSFIKMNA